MHVMNTERVLPIAGYPILEATPKELADHLLRILRHHEKVTLFYANSNFIVKCKPLINQMHDDSVVIVNDGVGMDIVARALHGRSFKANLNGTDFTPYLFRESVRPLRVFLLGGRLDVVMKAAIHVEQKLGQVVVGYCDGYQGMSDIKLTERINASGAEVLLVAMGNPLQESWILEHRDQLEVPIVSGVGALFDFWAGDKPRAPMIIQKLRLEWLYRLCLEPRRLLRRYTVDAVVFFADCFKYRKYLAPPPLQQQTKPQ
jgi:beta-1,4-glucosyltransferase